MEKSDGGGCGSQQLNLMSHIFSLYQFTVISVQATVYSISYSGSKQECVEACIRAHPSSYPKFSYLPYLYLQPAVACGYGGQEERKERNERFNHGVCGGTEFLTGSTS
jgi:hypothetical protein